MFYDFLHDYGRDPRDLDDLFDGLRSSAARSELEGPQDGGNLLTSLGR